MAIVTVFGGNYCFAEEISKRVADKLGYKFISEKQLIEETSARFSTSPEKIERALYGTPSLLNNITNEKERNIANLQTVLAEKIQKDNILYEGFASFLIPKNISHVLRVYVIANKECRIDNAEKTSSISSKEAHQKVRKQDNQSMRWVHGRTGKAPWDESLYDIVLPMHSISVEDGVRIICENATKEAVAPSEESIGRVKDFLLSSEIQRTLAEGGHNVDVSNEDGEITLLINKYIVRLEHYKEELFKITKDIQGIKSVDARFGPNVDLPKSFPGLDIDVPSRVLLVDDEVEFVHTLSERLSTRSIESSVVYDGEEALSVVEEQEPEVMILDLKMPGINGIEVLRKVKATHPEVEVIIMTGHGSDQERKLAEDLGAFAYLEKPVDIEILTKTMQEANKKVSKKKQQ